MHPQNCIILLYCRILDFKWTISSIVLYHVLYPTLDESYYYIIYILTYFWMNGSLLILAQLIIKISHVFYLILFLVRLLIKIMF